MSSNLQRTIEDIQATVSETVSDAAQTVSTLPDTVGETLREAGESVAEGIRDVVTANIVRPIVQAELNRDGFESEIRRQMNGEMRGRLVAGLILGLALGGALAIALMPNRKELLRRIADQLGNVQAIRPAVAQIGPTFEQVTARTQQFSSSLRGRYQLAMNEAQEATHAKKAELNTKLEIAKHEGKTPPENLT